MSNNNELSKNKSFQSWIDEKEEKCISESNVYNFYKCSEQAEKDWDKEIQNNLEKLKEIMPQNDYTSILETHTKWQIFINQEIEVINKFIVDKDGLIYQAEGKNSIVEIKKQYALSLQTLYDNCKD